MCILMKMELRWRVETLCLRGIPVVTGVKFNEMNLKRKILENKVPVKKNYFNTIVSITKKITTYKLKCFRNTF